MSITQNFILSGPPTGLSARSGVVAWDIQFNTKYIQTTIPAGSHWVIHSKNQYYTGSGGDADTLNGHPGSYYLDLTNATNLLPYTQVSGLSTVAHSGDYNDLSNKIALTTVGTSGAATLIGSTLNIPQYSGGGGGVTDVTASAPIASSGGTTPDISIPKATSLVDGYLSSTDWTTFNNKGSGTVTSVSGTSPLSSSGGTTPAISIADAKADGSTKGAAAFATNDFSDNGAGVVSIDYTNGQAASGSTKGFLTSADWTTFNNKGSGTVTSVSGTAPVVSSGGATPDISIPAATGSVDGYLSSTDWTTFNNKQAALGFTPEDVANKSTTTTLGTSDTLYPTQNAVKTYVDTQIAASLTVNKAMQAFLM